VFENRVLRGIFGPKREEVAGGCRRLHKEELHNLYASPNIMRVIKSRRIRWAGNIARIREMRNTYEILIAKREGKRPLGRPRCGKMWTEFVRLSQWRTLMNTIMNLLVP
jgi:hypothetical protein